MPYIQQIYAKGIAYGVIAFVVLYFVFSQYSTWAARTNNINHTLITYGGYFIWLFSGYLAGLISRKGGILNGAIVGVFTPIVMIIFMYIGFRNWEEIENQILEHGLFWLYAGFLICGIGGLFSDLQRLLLSRL